MTFLTCTLLKEANKDPLKLKTNDRNKKQSYMNMTVWNKIFLLRNFYHNKYKTFPYIRKKHSKYTIKYDHCHRSSPSLI